MPAGTPGTNNPSLKLHPFRLHLPKSSPTYDCCVGAITESNGKIWRWDCQKVNRFAMDGSVRVERYRSYSSAVGKICVSLQNCSLSCTRSFASWQRHCVDSPLTHHVNIQPPQWAPSRQCFHIGSWHRAIRVLVTQYTNISTTSVANQGPATWWLQAK